MEAQMSKVIRVTSGYDEEIVIETDAANISKTIADLFREWDFVRTECEGFIRLYCRDYLGHAYSASGSSDVDAQNHLPPLEENRDDLGNQLYSHPAIATNFRIVNDIWYPAIWLDPQPYRFTRVNAAGKIVEESRLPCNSWWSGWDAKIKILS
jgi:hypothetical protein